MVENTSRGILERLCCQNTVPLVEIMKWVLHLIDMYLLIWRFEGTVLQMVRDKEASLAFGSGVRYILPPPTFAVLLCILSISSLVGILPLNSFLASKNNSVGIFLYFSCIF
jgi:hypothetical protein